MTGFRTLIFACLLALGGVLQTFNWATIVPQNQVWSGMAMIGIGAIVAILRAITTTSVGVAPAK